ncbi:hypothetical protein GYMLUDRAFT_261292 [Collybiopsis luxurians FD-317 M1]|uniref:RNA helicase n=1 Tax=Collybiopsis luxurians FD-317 M1 TaxID=944289 RepID=A0A0D0BAI4_9AGAR|nr:hypothetical protein GYMLUDRAFT_261292 [Collybiopsis luxurians FD-317 M1]
MAKTTCPNILNQGTCTDPGCRLNHNVYKCALCSRIFSNQGAYNQHLSTKGHLKRTREAFFFCTICHKYVVGMNSWRSHTSSKRHVSKASAQGLSPDVPPEEPKQFPGYRLCIVCNRQIPNQLWANHPKQPQHKQRELFLKFTSALEETEKDKNGLSVIGDFDFQIVDPDQVASGVLRTGTIQSQVPSTQMTLMEVRLASSKGQKAFSPFVVTIHGSSRTITSRSPLTFSIKVSQAHLGRAEDRLELLFEDVKLQSRFMITRPVLVIVGSQADHKLLKPKVPYVPRKRTEKQPETNIIEGEAPPSTKAIPYVGKLPLARIPKDLADTLGTGSMKEILNLVRRLYLPPVLNSESYSGHFRHLLWMEEFQRDRDMEHYDIPDARLSKHKSLYHLEVPGLAEKRPSVLVGDQILIRDPRSAPGHWFSGWVYVVEKEEVGLKLGRSFTALTSDRLLARFKSNRIPMRRQHQALVSAFFEDRLIFPTDLHLPRTIPQSPNPRSTIQWRNPLIADNSPQKRAVLSIAYREPGSMPFVIFGPPGTGKTVTLVEAILQVLSINSASRILATAPSNSAADLIVSRLAAAGLNPTDLFRAYAPSRSKLDVPTSISSYSYRNANGQFSVPPMSDMLRFRIIVTTCVSASIVSGIGMPRGHFSHIFTDEAGQATEPEVMIGIRMMADKNTNVILAGDPKQLGPIIRSSAARILGLETSYLERLMKREVYDEVTDYGKSVVTLVKNFRSHNAILQFPNEKFYRNQLQCHGDPRTINFYLGSPHVVASKFPVVFHSISGKDDREASSPSFFNIDEVTLVKTLVQKLKSDKVLRTSDNDIGIIAPYHAQVLKIRKALKPVADAIKVGSVEEFQGQERRVIIISTVRSSKEFVEYDLRRTLGFVANPRRFNVAVTRAQCLLYIVGDPTVLSIDPLWRAFLNYIHLSGGWKGPPPMWDTREPVDESENGAGKYDAGVRKAAREDMNEFTRMMEAMTFGGVQALLDLEDADGEEEGDVDHNEDQPWNEDE